MFMIEKRTEFLFHGLVDLFVAFFAVAKGYRILDTLGRIFWKISNKVRVLALVIGVAVNLVRVDDVVVLVLLVRVFLLVVVLVRVLVVLAVLLLVQDVEES